MRLLATILCACCLATGCDDTSQPPKPSPLHYAHIHLGQCALGCCRYSRKHSVPKIAIAKHQPHSH